MSSIVGASESFALSRNTIISLQFQQLVAIALRAIPVFNMHRLLEYFYPENLDGSLATGHAYFRV